MKLYNNEHLLNVKTAHLNLPGTRFLPYEFFCDLLETLCRLAAGFRVYYPVCTIPIHVYENTGITGKVLFLHYSSV